MFKRIAFLAALTIIPASAFAQQSPGLNRDPAGGATRDPAMGTPGTPATGVTGVPATGMARDPAGGTMMADSPRFQLYVTQQRISSYRYADPLAVGTVLPSDGIVYREIPAQYGAMDYRYAVINDRTVLVEPRTRRVVQIIN